MILLAKHYNYEMEMILSHVMLITLPHIGAGVDWVGAPSPGAKSADADSAEGIRGSRS